MSCIDPRQILSVKCNILSNISAITVNYVIFVLNDVKPTFFSQLRDLKPFFFTFFGAQRKRINPVIATRRPL